MIYDLSSSRDGALFRGINLILDVSYSSFELFEQKLRNWIFILIAQHIHSSELLLLYICIILIFFLFLLSLTHNTTLLEFLHTILQHWDMATTNIKKKMAVQFPQVISISILAFCNIFFMVIILYLNIWLVHKVK